MTGNCQIKYHLSHTYCSFNIHEKCTVKFCRWLDSNHGPLVLEVTTLPTESHHCPTLLFRFIVYIFLNWPNPASFLFIFVLFSTQWRCSTKFDHKKCRSCAWDSNPGWQDGRRRRIHRASMAAPQTNFYNKIIFLQKNHVKSYNYYFYFSKSQTYCCETRTINVV